MKYEEFINELKNIPTIKEKEKQDALDAINLSSKILFDINEETLTKKNNSSKTLRNDLRKELFKTKQELSIRKEQIQEISRYLQQLHLSLQIDLMDHEEYDFYETCMIKACLKTVEIIFDGIIEINTKIHQNEDD